ncbi:putative polymerase [Sphaerotilus hippei]|uniref:Putative polymerase n=1 Tax=Sphaerotilus hippei TaxID=744406 RepID=A0A318H6D2_9BURK|nr:hypothetical protein [Sphaerotilus hippei]PXW94956.1 putative polymerase [Sphaerotilus hippei]
MLAASARLPRPLNARKPVDTDADQVFPGYGQCVFLLVMAVSYHWLLTFAHTNLHIQPTTTLVGLVELALYLWVIVLVLRAPRSMPSIVLFLFTMATMFVLAVLREGYLDPKAIRDLLIPFLFFFLASSRRATDASERRLVSAVFWVVVLGAVVEVGLAGDYGRVFNTFNYHVAIGTISAESAHFSGMDVTLNALRPQGIGTTALNWLVGQRRISSVFVEPVSLGNYCVVMFAWICAHPWAEVRRLWWMLLMVAFLMLLSDSRFAMVAVGALVLIRCLVAPGAMKALAMASPFVGVALAIGLAAFHPMHGDNLPGRLTTSGYVFMDFPPQAYFGLHAFAARFGDMGYAYALTRFGLPLVVVLWGVVALRTARTDRQTRFQSLALIYISMILSISGSSAFALKTAALTWFLIGLGYASSGPATAAVPPGGAIVAPGRARRGVFQP